MQTRSFATAAIAALALGLAGCVGPSPSPPPVTVHPRMFVANYANGSNLSSVVTYAYPYLSTSVPNMVLPNSGGPNGANGLAIDIFDDLYIANAAGNAVLAYLPIVTSASTPTAIITSGMSMPMDITFDGSGAMYVVNFTGSGTGDVTQYTPSPTFTSSTPAQFHLANGVSGPTGIVWDGVGTLFVANKTGGNVAAYTVAGISAASKPVYTITSHLSAPVAAAVDNGGSLYVADPTLNQISVFAPPLSSGTFNYAITSGVSAPRYVSFDSNQNLYVSNAASIAIYVRPLSAASTPAVTIVNGVVAPAGVGFGF